jgi:hypothetical protein
MNVKNTEEQIIFSDAWGDVEFSDNSKSGKLRILIDVGAGESRARWRLSGDDVVELRDWLNKLIAIYEHPSLHRLRPKKAESDNPNKCIMLGCENYAVEPENFGRYCADHKL